MTRFLVTMILCFASSAVFADNYWQPHIDSRRATVSAQAELLGQNDVMLFGDSNTEMFWWNTNAGCHILNAGFGGARMEDLALLAPAIANQARPKIVHIMAGTNNIANEYLATPEGQAAFAAAQANLTLIVTTFKSYGAKVVLWPIPPFTGTFGTNANRDGINAIIYSVAIAQNVYIDWWWPNTITAGGSSAPNGTIASGYAVPGALLGDGVHLSPASQTSRYYRMETWRNTVGVTCN